MKLRQLNTLVAFTAFLFLTIVPSSRSQQGTSGGYPRPTIPNSPSMGRLPNERNGDPFPDPIGTKVAADQARMRNNERQKKLEQDTEKLLQLANELKVEVDKSNRDTLSLTVIRKAEEIEKLAKSVKERMKG